MNDTLRSFYKRVKTVLFGVAAEPADTTPVSVPVPIQSPERSSTPVLEADSPAPATVTTISDEWTVRTYVDPVFVKIGRVYLDADALVLRSDLDARGFVIPEEDLDEALTGGIGAVLLLDKTATVGFARLSQSGLAMNIVIDTQLHTVPMRSLTPVLTGQNRKAPLFVPAEDLEPDMGE